MRTFADPELGQRDAPRPLLFRNARLIDPAARTDTRGDLLVAGGRIAEVGGTIEPPASAQIIDCNGAVLSPGLIDMQAHTGEPGLEHLETLASASRAAAAGGVTTIACMPCTDPPIDDPALVDFLHRRARDTAIVNIVPIAAATRGLEGTEMTEFGLLREAGAVAVASGRHAISDSGPDAPHPHLRQGLRHPGGEFGGGCRAGGRRRHERERGGHPPGVLPAFPSPPRP